MLGVLSRSAAPDGDAKAWSEITVDAVDLGGTATAFNGHSGPQTVTEGTDVIVGLATIGLGGPTGQFQHRHGVMPR